MLIKLCLRNNRRDDKIGSYRRGGAIIVTLSRRLMRFTFLQSRDSIINVVYKY